MFIILYRIENKDWYEVHCRQQHHVFVARWWPEAKVHWVRWPWASEIYWEGEWV